MRTLQIKQLNKKVNGLLSHKQRSVFPIMGGITTGEPTRAVTPEEQEILRSKGLPIPILISLNREQEFLKLIDS